MNVLIILAQFQTHINLSKNHLPAYNYIISIIYYITVGMKPKRISCLGRVGSG